MKSLSLLASLFAIALNVNAAEPAPAAEKTLAKSNCVKPEVLTKGASAEVIKAFNKGFIEYQSCTQKFLDAQKAISDSAIDAGNAARTEYLAFADQVAKAKEAINAENKKQ